MDYIESNLTFRFDEQLWDVIKYDDCTFYRNTMLKCVPDTKAVDFVSIYNMETVVIWEIKNFRHFGQNRQVRERLNNNAEDLCNEIALKVRDTIAGIFANARLDKSEQNFENVRSFLLSRRRELKVIAWIEENALQNRNINEKKVSLITKRSKLKQKLAWLGSIKVAFHDCTNQPTLDGFSCSFNAEN